MVLPRPPFARHSGRDCSRLARWVSLDSAVGLVFGIESSGIELSVAGLYVAGLHVVGLHVVGLHVVGLHVVERSVGGLVVPDFAAIARPSFARVRGRGQPLDRRSMASSRVRF